MRRSEWKERLLAAEKERDLLRSSVNRSWWLGGRFATVNGYDFDRISFDIEYRSDAPMSAGEYAAASLYRLAFERWMANELDEMPPSTERLVVYSNSPTFGDEFSGGPPK